MPIVIRCSCGKQLRVGDDLAGKKVRCPACSQVLTVEASPADDPEAKSVTSSNPGAPARPATPPPDEPEEDSPRDRVQTDRPSGKSARKSAPDDDEDMEEMEDDEEPDREERRRKTQRAKKGMGVGAWLAIILGSAALLLAVCGGLGFYLLFSAVGKVRSAAASAQSQNNLKQMGIAIHNIAATSPNGEVPTDIRDPAGKPLLSWRVALLPYIEQGAIHARFRLNEPWDSPNNRPLADLVPKVYQMPASKDLNLTHYKMFTGPGTLFSGGKKVYLPASFPKGTSNTVLIVEAANPCLWSKPEDIPFDPNGDPLTQLEWTDGKCNVLLWDGSVRRIPRSLNPQEFKNAITKDGPAANPNGW